MGKIAGVPTSVDTVTQALQSGWIPLGEAKLRLGSTIADAAQALGIDPEKPAYGWREVGGEEGRRWTVNCGFLWSSPPPGGVELIFHDDRLTQVAGGDAAWQFSGTSWNDYSQASEIRNYWRSRKELQARLGAPRHSDERSDSLLVASWVQGGFELSLCFESRTPSLSIRLHAPGPRR